MAKKKSTNESAAMARALDVGRTLADETLKRRRRIRKARQEALKAFALEAAAPSPGVLVAEGDSWFDYPFYDILNDLDDDYGYDIESVAHRGDTVEDMAYSGGQLDEFARRVEKVMARGQTLKAILLSGGGNDVAGDPFAMLINHAMSSAPGINDAVVSGVIDQRVQAAYLAILGAVTKVCEAHTGHPVPIVIHGYDYPVPDGRGYLGGWGPLPGPWLEPGFRAKGYEKMKDRQPIVVDLLDRFNAMLARVAGQLPHVHYLNLRKTLSIGTNYKDWWGNEMHPTSKGFDAVSAKFAALLSTL